MAPFLTSVRSGAFFNKLRAYVCWEPLSHAACALAVALIDSEEELWVRING